MGAKVIATPSALASIAASRALSAQVAASNNAVSASGTGNKVRCP